MDADEDLLLPGERVPNSPVFRREVSTTPPRFGGRVSEGQVEGGMCCVPYYMRRKGVYERDEAPPLPPLGCALAILGL